MINIMGKVMSKEYTCPSGHKFPVEKFHSYVDTTIADLDNAVIFDCPGGKRGHSFSLRKAVGSGMFSIEEGMKIRQSASSLKIKFTIKGKGKENGY